MLALGGLIGGKSGVKNLKIKKQKLEKMAGFDNPGVYYSDSLFSDERPDEADVSKTASQRKFKDFIKTFMDHRNNYCYR